MFASEFVFALYMFVGMCCIFGFNCIFLLTCFCAVSVLPVLQWLDGNQIAVMQSGKPSALMWKVMVASGNDCVPSCQTFTLADEQNIKFDREWVFSPHDPKILHVPSHTVKVFLQRWSGYSQKNKFFLNGKMTHNY